MILLSVNRDKSFKSMNGYGHTCLVDQVLDQDRSETREYCLSIISISYMYLQEEKVVQ